MHEFSSTNKSNFFRNTMRRVFIELLVFLLLVISFFSEFTNWIPIWLKFIIILIYLIFMVGGLLLYKEAKASADNHTYYLLDNGLGFWTKNGIKELLYSTLKIKKVIRLNGDIIAIILLSKFGGDIKIAHVENLDVLYGGLIAKGVKNIQGVPK